MEKKVLTTTEIATDYNLPFLQVFALIINIFLMTIDWAKITEKFVPRFKSFLQSKFVLVNSKICAEKSLDCADDTPVSEDNGGFDNDDHNDEDLRSEDVEMVMGRLGLFCSPKSDELGESFGCDAFSRLFEDEEPSLEELKEAFDVFDESRDGFIDSKELQRVLRLLGLKQRTEIEDCERMIRTVDQNRDGRVDFNEFVKFMENIFC